MIKQFLVFFVVLSNIASFAQDLTIMSCKYNPKDSTYITSQRYDINGNPCSIIKLFANEIIGKLEFKGNIVGKVIENEGKIYTLYVLDKTKKIKVFHADYIPKVIDFTEYEDSKKGLEQNKVYNVHIMAKGKQYSSKVSYPLGARLLSFSSDNQIKRLVVDGIEWKITNNCGQKMMPYGKYEYEAHDAEGNKGKGVVDLQPEIGSKRVKIVFNLKR